jgi:hypothetical protein
LTLIIMNADHANHLDGWLLEYEWVCIVVSWNYYPNLFGV